MLSGLAFGGDFCGIAPVRWNERCVLRWLNVACDWSKPAVIIFRVEHNRHRLHRLQVHVCQSRFERGRGLLLRRRPGPECAWLLPGRRTAHTIGLHYPVDVLFCDGAGRILRIERALAPGRMARERDARQVWQLCAGGAELWGWNVGDQIRPC
jgi:uncharacterized membrane protein (UPF0127 family)